MHLRDLLLVIAAFLLSAAGWMVAPAAGLAVGGACAAAMWFLLGEVSE